MKKTILATLIAAGISTAPLANELAKLKFATDSGAQTPAQQTAVSEKVAQKSASSKAEEDTIPELIFDQTDIRQLAVLTPDEMAQTEGAVWPAIAAFALAGAAIGGWSTHYDSIQKTGHYADYPDLGKGMVEGAVVGTSLYNPAVRVGAYTGTPGHWIRFHKSYSQAGNFKTVSASWGSNKRYRQEIGSQRLRELNETLRNARFPGNSWRTQDPGHFHFWKR